MNVWYECRRQYYLAKSISPKLTTFHLSVDLEVGWLRGATLPIRRDMPESQCTDPTYRLTSDP